MLNNRKNDDYKVLCKRHTCMLHTSLWYMQTGNGQFQKVLVPNYGIRNQKCTNYPERIQQSMM